MQNSKCKLEQVFIQDFFVVVDKKGLKKIYLKAMSHVS